jgi:hypothetical protein
MSELVRRLVAAGVEVSIDNGFIVPKRILEWGCPINVIGLVSSTDDLSQAFPWEVVVGNGRLHENMGDSGKSGLTEASSGLGASVPLESVEERVTGPRLGPASESLRPNSLASASAYGVAPANRASGCSGCRD